MEFIDYKDALIVQYAKGEDPMLPSIDHWGLLIRNVRTGYIGEKIYHRLSDAKTAVTKALYGISIVYHGEKCVPATSISLI